MKVALIISATCEFMMRSYQKIIFSLENNNIEWSLITDAADIPPSPHADGRIPKYIISDINTTTIITASGRDADFAYPRIRAINRSLVDNHIKLFKPSAILAFSNSVDMSLGTALDDVITTMIAKQHCMSCYCYDKLKNEWLTPAPKTLSGAPPSAEMLKIINNILFNTPSPDAAIQNSAPKARKRDLTGDRIIGVVESLHDGQIIHTSEMWIKGWIELSENELNNAVIEISINDETLPAKIERRRDANEIIRLRFEALIPLEKHGSRLKTVIVIKTTEGPIAWKKYLLWNNNSIPKRPIFPVIRWKMNAAVKANADDLIASLLLSIEGDYSATSFSLWQDGKKFGSCHLTKFDNSYKGDVSFPVVDIDINGNIYAWIEIESIGMVFLGAMELTRKDDEIHVRKPVYGNTRIIDSDVAIDRKSIVNGTRFSPTESSLYHGGALSCEDNGNRTSYFIHPGDPIERVKFDYMSLPQLDDGIEKNNKTHSDRFVVIRKQPSPTDELYIIAPLRALGKRMKISIAVIDTDEIDQEKFAELKHAFLGSNIIISRYCPPWIAEFLANEKSKIGKIFYLMDDDVVSAIDSKWLPGGYRDRMTKVARGEFKTLYSICDRFIVTSDNLFAKFKTDKTDLITPPYLTGPRDLGHHTRSKEMIISYHGTQVHRDDLLSIAPSLRRIHDEFPCSRIQIVIGQYVPPQLKGLPRVDVVPGMNWCEYKDFVANNRAHIGLAPALNTPYNMGKSIIKFMDITSLGAVGVYSRGSLYGNVIEHGQDGLLLENDGNIWFKGLRWLINNRDKTFNMALKAQRKALEIGHVDVIARYWEKHAESAHE